MSEWEGRVDREFTGWDCVVKLTWDHTLSSPKLMEIWDICASIIISEPHRMVDQINWRKNAEG